MTEQLSNCCNAPVKVCGSHETTRWFECTKCGFSCNATTDTAKLAKCMCGNEPQWGNADGKHWVKCPNYDCHALTPRFSAQVLADAAWNRMMGGSDIVESFRSALTPLANPPDARNLLSALADELLRREDFHSNAKQSPSMCAAIGEVGFAIRTVLEKKP